MAGDNHLRDQLEVLRVNYFEQRVDERAMALVQQEAEQQDLTSTERAIIDSARVLRDRIIDVQAQHLKIQRATRLSRWLLTRHPIPKIRFGLGEEDRLGWDNDEMSVATAPLMATEEETVDGKVTFGWVFQLKSPMPEVMAWYGDKDPPIHVWGRYDRSPIDIYRVAEDQTTGLQAKEEWFTIDPDTQDISCWQLAKKRGGTFAVLDDEPVPEEDRHFGMQVDEETGQARFVIRKLSPEAEERDRQRTQRVIDRIREQYAPDLETGLQMLGLIRGSLQELS
jgi:hypothetical protein